MATITDFNVSPYYDDFADSNNYHRVLFRPSYALQARELTQAQTILQAQIERFGNHTFKEGDVVVPGSVQVVNRASIKLTSFTGTSTLSDLKGSNLNGIDLTDTLADRVNFQKTDLRNSILINMIASGSSFAGAQIEGADFSYAILDSEDQRNLCKIAEEFHV